MAKQSGIIKLEGTIGDLTFYKTQDGMMARIKGGVSSERIQSAASYARTRENMQEFSRAGTGGKVLRNAFRFFIQNGSDNRMVSRLTRAMMGVIKADATSTRGQRNVLDGELELLEGFDFNINAKLSATVFIAYSATIDRATGALKVSIPAFSTAGSVTIPEGATHMKFLSGGASINFEAGTSELASSASADIALDQAQVAAIELLNQLPANSTHPLFLVFGVEFYQLVNGTKYSLKNGNFNALSLVKVLGL